MDPEQSNNISRLIDDVDYSDMRITKHESAVNKFGFSNERISLIKLELQRRKLVTDALRFDQKGSKNQKTENPYESTEFKPFSIRELEYDIYD